MFIILDEDFTNTSSQPAINLQMVLNYVNPSLYEAPKKAAPPLKDGGESKTDTFPGISKILQSKHSINRSVTCTQTQYTRKIPT